MGKYTTQTMYKSERRSVQLTIRDSYDQFEPDSASAEIKNSTGTLMASGGILTSLNMIYCDVPTAVTANVGEYYILWNVHKDGSLYRHRTDLLV